jgi:tRNA threonylcarbamoyladenosine biosynthesis protein TsaB
VVVGFDTATADTAACCWRDGEVLHESLLGLSPDGRPRHATALLEEVERAAAAAGGWSQVDRVAVGLGPGTFTGLRIGVATARGLAASLGLPVTGVCTLDAIDRALGEHPFASPTARAVPSPEISGERNSARLVAFDARRGEVFAALYSASGERIWEPLVCKPEELAERVAALPEPPRAAGSGAIRFRDELTPLGVEIPDDADPVHRVAARHICALAAAAGDDGEGGLDPIYLRPPDAERWRERDAFQRTQ